MYIYTRSMLFTRDAHKWGGSATLSSWCIVCGLWLSVLPVLVHLSPSSFPFPPLYTLSHSLNFRLARTGANSSALCSKQIQSGKEHYPREPSLISSNQMASSCCQSNRYTYKKPWIQASLTPLTTTSSSRPSLADCTHSVRYIRTSSATAARGAHRPRLYHRTAYMYSMCMYT